MASTSKVQEHSVRNIAIIEPQFKSVKVRLMIDAIFKVENTPSGREYVFPGAGSVQDVDERDVDFLLAKQQGERRCCGGGVGGNVIFALAEVT